jgi:hypothetical protein
MGTLTKEEELLLVEMERGEEDDWMATMWQLKEKEASGKYISEEEVTLLEKYEDHRISRLEIMNEEISKKDNRQDKDIL